MDSAVYEVKHAQCVPVDWATNRGFWERAVAGQVEHFHPAGTAHRPATSFRLLWSGEDLYLRFDVLDQHVRCVHTARQSPVCVDSCVEFFVQPADHGYVNLEFSATGTVLSSHILNATRTPTGFVDYRMLSDSELDLLEIHSSLKGPIEPERHGPTAWWLAARVPSALLRPARAKAPSTGDQWRANFFKCGDQTSMPHWGSWSEIGDQLNFHQPSRFGTLRFS
jgi:hypothetical protein